MTVQTQRLVDPRVLSLCVGGMLRCKSQVEIKTCLARGGVWEV